MPYYLELEIDINGSLEMKRCLIDDEPPDIGTYFPIRIGVAKTAEVEHLFTGRTVYIIDEDIEEIDGDVFIVLFGRIVI